MRSYEAARTLSSFLGFCAWCVILGGGLFALMGAAAAAQMSSRFGGPPSGLAVFTGLLPGGGVSLLGFVLLALVQYGRATVDAAEYAQQSLAISREQLEISKQALRQGTSNEPGFAALRATKDEIQSGTNYRSLDAGTKRSSPASSQGDAQPSSKKPDAYQLGVNDAVTPTETTYDINGQQLTQLADGTFTFDDKSFASLDAVKDHVKLKSMASRFGGKPS